MVLLVSCTGRNTKHYYETYTGKVITVWKDYIIFEKYEGNNPPETNYIQINHWYKEAEVFFKDGDTILVFSTYQPEILDANFDTNKYHVEIYGNDINDINKYFQKTSYSDPSSQILYSFGTNRHCLEPRFFEMIGDSVYMKAYNVSSDIIFAKYNEEKLVFPRYEKRSNPYILYMH